MPFRRGLNCEKMFHHQKRDARGEIRAGAFAVGVDVRAKLHIPPSKIAQQLDNFQYMKCKEIEKLDKDDPKRDYIERYRNAVIGVLTSLQNTVEVINCVNSEENRKELTRVLVASNKLLMHEAEQMMENKDNHQKGITTSLSIRTN